MKHLIVGMGQVGDGLATVLNRYGNVVGKHDPDKGLHFRPTKEIAELVMHICIPFSSDFCDVVQSYQKEFFPRYTIIHSTVAPGTGWKLFSANGKTYTSPIRGNHTSLAKDLNRYVKYIAPRPPEALLNELMRFFSVKTCDKPETLEVAKLLDTAQYGILIAFSQTAERICRKYNVEHKFVRDFGRKTNQFYEVRPNIIPNFCGGNCIRQNIALLKTLYDSKFFDAFIESNQIKARELGIDDEVDYDIYND